MEVLFYLNTNYIYIISSHSPHGECGLKYNSFAAFAATRIKSLPTRGVWIEIYDRGKTLVPVAVTPHTGSVD